MSNKREGGEALGGPDGSGDAGQGPPRPTHIYINHLLRGSSTRPHAYVFALAGRDAQQAVQDAIPDIIAGRHRVPNSPHNIEWRHPSYVAFILDDPDDRLNGIDFHHETTRSNHTFFEKKTLTDFGTYTGVYYLNYRQDKDGEPLGDKREKYHWEADHDHHHEKDSPDTHENSGTNVGP